MTVSCPSGNGPTPIDVPLKLLIARLSNGISPASLAQAGSDWFVHLLTSPSKQLELAGSAARMARKWSHYVAASMHGGTGEDCVQPCVQDKRFARPEWQALPWSALAQAFLLQQQWWTEATRGVRGVSAHHEEVVAFVARQWLDMWSPSNFIATNPQVLRETWSTGGRNLASGMVNWMRDATALAGGASPRGVEEFRVGENVAVTPGKVVMRNHLAEVLQYEPATPQVDKEPVLIVPSWIMKFYILDLTQHDSLVKYLVSQGHTVFMVSWRNPGSRDAGLGMRAYLQQGVMEPIEAVHRICRGASIHAAGYCLGGTLLAIAAAMLAGEGRHVLKTITLLAGQVDFEEPGELGLFMDESQIAFLEDLMAEHGYLDGVQMAGAFQLINSKDLVWSKLVHEYLMGARTPMTALRAWNADATRLPARMHAEYLRHLYLHNDLAHGRFHIDGRPVDLLRIKAPMFVVGTERDHVSPWRSVYKLHHLVHSAVDFVLASGGHNVGIVSAPEGPARSSEASYRRAHSVPHAAPLDPGEWLRHSAVHTGSWWPAWERWLHQHSSGRVRARVLSRSAKSQAPGTYVFQT